jgi:uridine kinase
VTVEVASIDEVVAAIERAAMGRRRCVVGVSGYGGSGKSTLTRALLERLPDVVRVRGDDFLDPPRVFSRSDDWSGVERIRLREEVLDPYRRGQAVVFRRYDWSAGRLGREESLPEARILVVDLIGLLHPELDGCFDLTVWVDTDLETATQRGRARDRALGNEHDRVWDEVWAPNERDFERRFRPRETAGLRFAPPAGPQAP